MTKYDENEGVWRTIGGRRVFIRTGQDLASAMKESGKFKIHNAKAEEEYELYKKARQDESSIDPMTENSTDWEALDRKYRDRYEKEEVAKSSKGAWKEIEADNKKYGRYYLPKKTQIKEQGNSNRQEVRENIQAHILDHYDNPVDFMEQMEAMDYLPTRWKAGEELAKGGNYLIYNKDMADYLASLKINPKNKGFTDEQVFERYTSLIGRESEHLYNKLEKLYEKYKAEHKNSEVTLDDFRKWFK